MVYLVFFCNIYQIICWPKVPCIGHKHFLILIVEWQETGVCNNNTNTQHHHITAISNNEVACVSPSKWFYLYRGPTSSTVSAGRVRVLSKLRFHLTLGIECYILRWIGEWSILTLARDFKYRPMDIWSRVTIKFIIRDCSHNDFSHVDI